MPIKLKPARAWRTYQGGSRIDALHGAEKPEDSNFPEEWIISTVAANNPGREEFAGEGLSISEDGESTLADLIRSDPAGSLGEKHVNKFGASTGVLVKLLDAAERLAIQVHPDKASALRLFGSKYGKTECWYILPAGSSNKADTPCIYMGFKPGISKDKWRKLFDRQDINGMLDCLHRIEVSPGETYLVESGVPHAIGPGCFLVEIQEPTDFTLRVEKTTISGRTIPDERCHLGAGFEEMLSCFKYEGLTCMQTLDRWRIKPLVIEESEGVKYIEAVGHKDTPCFRMTVLTVGQGRSFKVPPEDIFSGLYILEGQGKLFAGREGSEPIFLKPGDQFFIPAGMGGFSIKGTAREAMKLMRFFGPDIR